MALAAQADRQYGLLTRPQIESGLSRGQFERRVREGILLPAGPRGVWRLAGAQPSWRQRVMATCLSIGPPVAASHSTAARLWSIEAIAPVGLHVVVPPGRSGRPPGAGQSTTSSPGPGKPAPAPDLVVHHGDLPADAVAQRYGIPVTSPARTILDLGGDVPPDALARAVDELKRARLLGLEELRAERCRRPRLRGVGSVDRILHRWQEGAGDSGWEERVFGWLVDAGLPVPVRQHPVELGDGSLAVLDLAYPRHRVGVEFDGWTWHQGRDRFDRDRARASALAAAGWLVVTVTSAHPPPEVVARVRQALALRAAPDLAATDRPR